MNLAAPDYTDDFSTAYKWVGPDDPASATNRMGSGKLEATDHKADGYIWWTTTDQSAGDSYAEVSAAIGACSGKDAAGLSIRVNGAGFDQAYALEFSRRPRGSRGGSFSGWWLVSWSCASGQARGRSGRDSVAWSKIGLEQKSSLGAPRNAPLRTGRKPGAETALFL